MSVENNASEEFFSAQDSPSQPVSEFHRDFNCALSDSGPETALHFSAKSRVPLHEFQRAELSHITPPMYFRGKWPFTKDTIKNCHGFIKKRKIMEKEYDKFFPKNSHNLSKYIQSGFFQKLLYKFLLY